ncbi:MAG: crossover junction endodeoxyribonuclease RuvC [Dehalococcoidia bacterium]
MRFLGVDPGLTATGYGVVEVRGDRCLHLAHGAVRTRPADGIAARLSAIRDAVRDIARQWAVDAASIEASFVGTNARSALQLGQARAAAILGVADAGLPVFEYTPALVKQTVAGYGRGEKAQVGEMVRMQLGLASVPSPADAADALAIAITHWAHARIGALIPPR